MIRFQFDIESNPSILIQCGGCTSLCCYCGILILAWHRLHKTFVSCVVDFHLNPKQLQTSVFNVAVDGFAPLRSPCCCYCCCFGLSLCTLYVSHITTHCAQHWAPCFNPPLNHTHTYCRDNLMFPISLNMDVYELWEEIHSFDLFTIMQLPITDLLARFFKIKNATVCLL